MPTAATAQERLDHIFTAAEQAATAMHEKDMPRYTFLREWALRCTPAQYRVWDNEVRRILKEYADAAPRDMFR